MISIKPAFESRWILGGGRTGGELAYSEAECRDIDSATIGYRFHEWLPVWSVECSETGVLDTFEDESDARKCAEEVQKDIEEAAE